MWYLKDDVTGKYLTVYGMKKIWFTDNKEIAHTFDTEQQAVQFEDDHGHDFQEYTKPVFIP